MALRAILSKQRSLSTLLSPPSSLRCIATASLLRHQAPPSLTSVVCSRWVPRFFSSVLEEGFNPPPSGGKLDPEKLLPGCDFKHWIVFVETPPEGTSRDDIIDGYVKMLAKVVGSEEEAKMKIYSVSTRCYYAFGAIIPREACDALREMSNVHWVLPDSYIDPKTKNYGGEPFIDGKAVPYDPKYHETWLRNRRYQEEQGRHKGDLRRQNRPRPMRDFSPRHPAQNRDSYQQHPAQNRDSYQQHPSQNPDSHQQHPAQNRDSYQQHPAQNRDFYQQHPGQNRDFQRPPGPSMPNHNREFGNPSTHSAPSQNPDFQSSWTPSVPDHS